MRVLEGLAGPIASASTAAIATAQIPTGGTALTLNTNATLNIPSAGLNSPLLVPTSVYSFNTAGIPVAEMTTQPYIRSGGLVTLTGTSGATAHNYTIVGLDRYGNAISEVLLGPAGTATVTSTLIYGTVISITPSTTSADDVSAGYAADSFTRWIGLANFKGHYLPLINVSWPAASTATYTIEATDAAMNSVTGPGGPVYGETPDNVATIQVSGTTQNTGLKAAAAAALGGPFAFVRAHFSALTGGIGRLRVIPSVTA